MNRVSALPASHLQVAALLALLEELLQKQLFFAAFDQPTSELREHGEVEAGIGQSEAQGVFPVYAGTLLGHLLREEVLQDGRDAVSEPGPHVVLDGMLELMMVQRRFRELFAVAVLIIGYGV